MKRATRSPRRSPCSPSPPCCSDARRRCVPRSSRLPPPRRIELADPDAMLERLAAAIRIPTISHQDRQPGRSRRLPGVPRSPRAQLPAAARDAATRDRERAQPRLHLAGSRSREARRRIDGAPGRGARRAGHRSKLGAAAVLGRDRRRLRLGPRHDGHQGQARRDLRSGRAAAARRLPAHAHDPPRVRPRRGSRRARRRAA